MKIIGVVALVLGLGACSKGGGDDTANAASIFERIDRDGQKICKCTEGGVDPQKCAAPIAAAHEEFLAKAAEKFQSGAIKFDDDTTKVMMENVTNRYNGCRSIALGGSD